jgi:hypothetical protein
MGFLFLGVVPLGSAFWTGVGLAWLNRRGLAALGTVKASIAMGLLLVNVPFFFYAGRSLFRIGTPFSPWLPLLGLISSAILLTFLEYWAALVGYALAAPMLQRRDGGSNP